MLCEQCGQHEATAFVAHARSCADGTQSRHARNLCSSCVDTLDPRAAARKRIARLKRFEREFAEMRACLAELVRVGDPVALARTASSAASWLAEVAATAPDIDVPADLIALAAQHSRPATDQSML